MMVDLESELRALRDDDGHAAKVAIAGRVEHRIARRARARKVVAIVAAGAVGAAAGWVAGRWTASGLATLADVHSAVAIQAMTAVFSCLVCAMAAFAVSAILAARPGNQ